MIKSISSFCQYLIECTGSNWLVSYCASRDRAWDSNNTVQIVIMRLSVVLRTASTRLQERLRRRLQGRLQGASRKASTGAPRGALKGRGRHVRSIYARHGKMNKRCLFTVFAFKNILSNFYIYRGASLRLTRSLCLS